MLPEFAKWWLEQMRSLLPARFTAGSRYADAVVLRTTPTGLTLATRRRGAEAELGPLTGRDALRRLGPRPSAAVVLRLPPASLLEQSASLPLAAERDLVAVLRNEMDRLTPFRADELFWDWRGGAAGPGQRQAAPAPADGAEAGGAGSARGSSRGRGCGHWRWRWRRPADSPTCH